MSKLSKKLVALALCGALLVPTSAMAGELDAASQTMKAISKRLMAALLQEALQT